MDDKNKNMNTSLWHPKIKKYNASIKLTPMMEIQTFLNHFGNLKQTTMFTILPQWKIQSRILP
jgi:hypothetical protein